LSPVAIHSSRVPHVPRPKLPSAPARTPARLEEPVLKALLAPAAPPRVLPETLESPAPQLPTVAEVPAALVHPPATSASNFHRKTPPAVCCLRSLKSATGNRMTQPR